MQIKLIFGFLLIGACLTKVTLASPLTEVERGIIDDLIEQAQNGINKLIELLNSTIDQALNYFQKAKEQITNIAQEAIDAVTQKINEIIASAMKEIDEIKKKADELGIDITDCIKDNEEHFKSVLDDLIQDEMQCVQSEVDQATQIVNDAIKIVTDAYQSVTDLPEKLKNCGIGWSSITCVKDVIVEVVYLQKDLPGKVTGKVTEVTQFVAGLKIRLEKCATTELVNAGVETSKLVAEVAKCAANKQ